MASVITVPLNGARQRSEGQLSRTSNKAGKLRSHQTRDNVIHIPSALFRAVFTSTFAVETWLLDRTRAQPCRPFSFSMTCSLALSTLATVIRQNPQTRSPTRPPTLHPRV